MPARVYNASSYRYGLNGQEKDTNIQSDHYTAEYWEYDSRSGRRWNLDPKPTLGISQYSAFNNNPIWYNDPLGDSTESTHTDKFGKVLAVYNDGDLGVYKHDIAASQYNGENLSKSDKNTTLMGYTYLWNSFTNRGTQNKPEGTINFGSSEAYEWLSNFEASMHALRSKYGSWIGLRKYAINAGNGDKYDFKSKGADPYRGSIIYTPYNDPAHPVYVSARDVGNIAPGIAANIMGQSKLDFMLNAGAFALSHNNKSDFFWNTYKWIDKAKAVGPPAYGEDYESHFFQSFGYDNWKFVESPKTYTVPQ
jgi:hypothetical protein